MKTSTNQRNGLMKSAKILSITAASLVALSGTLSAQAAQQRTIIENIVAVQAAQAYCGASLNLQMLGVVMSASGIAPEDLMRGGRFHHLVETRTARVKKLASTDSGRTSFCNRVETELSAMFN